MVSLKKTHIAYFGSCRIATPLKKLSRFADVEIETSRNYGFVHSVPEITQQVAFFKGDARPPNRMEPYLSPNADMTDLWNRPCADCDIAVVEISSAKTYWFEYTPLQSNYLSQHFKNQLSPQGFTAFREGLKDCDFKRVLEQYSDQISHMDARLLGGLTVTRSTEGDLADLFAMLEKSFEKIVIVPHVNAVGADHRPLQSRAAWRENVLKVAGNTNCQIFDPTDLMDRVGQSRALADHSDSLAHFTDEFSSLWAAEFGQQVLGRSYDRNDLQLLLPKEIVFQATHPLKAADLPDVISNRLVKKLLQYRDLPAEVTRHVLEKGDKIRRDLLIALILKSSELILPRDASDALAKHIWDRFLASDPPILLRFHRLAEFARQRPLPKDIVRIEQREIRRAAKRASDNGDRALLEQIARTRIQGFDLPADIHLYRSRQAYFAQDWSHCVEQGLIALQALPDNKGGWIRLGRAASALGRSDIASQAQARLTELERAAS